MKNLPHPQALIITHSSTFHADEVFGCALLDFFLSRHKFVRIKRTLKPEELIEEYSSDHNVIVLDIGKKLGEFDGIFHLDHHQSASIPCAAVLAKNWLCEQFPEEKEVIEMTCRDWLPGVNSHDLGLAKMEDGIMSLSQVISTFLPKDISDMDERFWDALEFASQFVSRQYNMAKDKIKEIKIIEDKIRGATENYIVFDEYYRESAIILSKLEDDKILYFIYPHGRGGWAIQTVNQKGCMLPRKKIPADVAGAKFVHAAGFLATFETIEQALAAVKTL